MIITDLFSHKIHSSGDDWPQKLIEIASVFAEFDGMPYDRTVIEERFKQISPRASIVARDPSKYRDEISAYPAYLGLYRLELHNNQWILKLSETAKRFLIVEEPNVAAFMTLQLSMFQYPNGNGVSYQSNDRFRLQQNAGNRTLNFINAGIHLSPFRLICKALLADSIINGIDSLHPRVSIGEISILCNTPNINTKINPSIDDVVFTLKNIRENNISVIPKFERRFHILKHTDFIDATGNYIHLRAAYSPEDSVRLVKLLNIFSNLDIQYTELDNINNFSDLSDQIHTGSWFKYFDGVAQLSSDIVHEVADDYLTADADLSNFYGGTEVDELVADNKTLVFKYPLRERGSFVDNSVTTYDVKKMADPEVTRIKRQKSNLRHKILLSQLDEYLRKLGAKPMDNEHIDLYAELPNNGSFLFEVKSVNSENLLSQTRKGLSQLYEYRFRYSDDIKGDATLCLIYPKEPNEIDWLQDYLCNDRNIAVAWFEEEQLRYSSHCAAKMNHLSI
jgi:hypothetical protein